MKLFLTSLLYLYISNLSAHDLIVWNFEEKSFLKSCSAEYLENGYLMTAAHCLQGFNQGEIMAISKQGITFEVKSISTHPFYNQNFIHDQFDFALLKIEQQLPSPDISDVQIGQSLVLGDKIALVTNKSKSEFKVKIMNGSLCLGDSGSGIYNIKGDLVGILSRGDPSCKKFAIFTTAQFIKNWASGKTDLAKEYKMVKAVFIKNYLIKLKKEKT